MNDRTTSNVGTNKQKNKSQLPEMVGTSVHNRNRNENFECWIIKGMTLNDSVADKKKLVFSMVRYCASLFFLPLPLSFSNEPSVILIFSGDVELLFCVALLPHPFIHVLEFWSQAYERKFANL